MNKGIYVLVWMIVILMVTSFFPSAAIAQLITKNQYNGFSRERNIETAIVSLKQGFSTGLGVAYQAVNKNYYISFIGYGKDETSITEDDRIQFIMKDGSVVKFSSRIDLPSNESDVPNVFIHHYFINLNDIEACKNGNVVIVRIVSPGYDTDIAVNKKNARNFNKLSEAFFKEVSK